MAAEATAILATGNEEQERTVNPSRIAVTVTLATLMDVLDTAIANVSLPHIAGGLATSYDESTWVVTSIWLQTQLYYLSVTGSALCSPVRPTIMGG
jgi:DHA2 family multidrug resistance protein